MDAYDSTELSLCKWPGVSNQIHVKRAYSFGAREPAHKVRIPIETNDGAAELR